MRKLSLLSLLLCAALLAQLNTGTLVGVIVDSSGASVLGAEIVLTSELTGDTRKTLSADNGNFTLPGIPAGTYTLKISMQGFQTVERKGLVVASNEYLPAGTITLQLGSTTEVVSVTGSQQREHVAAAREHRAHLLGLEHRGVFGAGRLHHGAACGARP